LYNPRTLVTKQMRQELIVALHGVDFVDLGAANAAVTYINECLTKFKFTWKLNVSNGKGFIGFSQDGCFHMIDFRWKAQGRV